MRVDVITDFHRYFHAGAGASEPKAAKKASAQEGKVVDADVEIVDEEKK